MSEFDKLKALLDRLRRPAAKPSPCRESWLRRLRRHRSASMRPMAGGEILLQASLAFQPVKAADHVGEAFE